MVNEINLNGIYIYKHILERTLVFKTWYRLTKNRSDLILYSSQSNMNKKNLELCPSPEIRGVNVLNGMPKNTEHTEVKVL